MVFLIAVSSKAVGQRRPSVLSFCSYATTATTKLFSVRLIPDFDIPHCFHDPTKRCFVPG